MDAAPQFLHCGINPSRRPLGTGVHGVGRMRVRRREFPTLSRVRRSGTVAVATGPRPGTISASSSDKSRGPTNGSINGAANRFGNVSDDIKRVRAQMEEDEQLAILMRGLRGQNLSDSQFADENIRLRLVEVTAAESCESLPLVYDPDIISLYWRKRPRAVATRIIQLLSVAGGFLSNLALDLINKKIKENEVARAIELREIVTSLGPAYIKLGQALSIRPDILSPAAMTELQKLCDKVPSFPDDVAMALIEEELGHPWQEIYSELTASPIAAASLGQVYKGRLKETGELVAVKVQRPFVLETVTVDLYIIRKLGLFLRKFPQVSIDVVGLVDEWASRFFEELDYVNEGENGTRFAEMMREDLPQVVVPKTYHKYTSRKVLTTQWIDGEKLSQSTESDVGALVNVGVICYLKQIVKAIDAVSRDQLVRMSAAFGFGNVAPVFSMVPLKPASLLPTITEEDEVILNNVEKVFKFLTAGTSTMTSNQDINIAIIMQELLPVLPGIAAKVLPEVTSRLASRVLARLIRDTFL